MLRIVSVFTGFTATKTFPCFNLNRHISFTLLIVKWTAALFPVRTRSRRVGVCVDRG